MPEIATLSLLQIATGNSVREEAIAYVVANNEEAITNGINKAFDVDCYSTYYGTFKSFTLGKPKPNGCIPLLINYIDEYGDEEQTEWELRPVTVFL